MSRLIPEPKTDRTFLAPLGIRKVMLLCRAGELSAVTESLSNLPEKFRRRGACIGDELGNLGAAHGHKPEPGFARVALQVTVIDRVHECRLQSNQALARDFGPRHEGTSVFLLAVEDFQN